METQANTMFLPTLSSYPTPPGASILEILKARIQADPFNLVATIIFVFAIVHTFVAPAFLRWSHRLQLQHQERLGQNKRTIQANARQEVSFFAEFFHFLG